MRAPFTPNQIDPPPPAMNEGLERSRSPRQASAPQQGAGAVALAEANAKMETALKASWELNEKLSAALRKTLAKMEENTSLATEVRQLTCRVEALEQRVAKDDELKGDAPKDDKPSGDDDKPSGDDDKPKGDDDKPKGDEDKPQGGDDKPQGGDDKPKGDDDKLQSGDEEELLTQKPKGGGELLTQGDMLKGFDKQKADGEPSTLMQRFQALNWKKRDPSPAGLSEVTAEDGTDDKFDDSEGGAVRDGTNVKVDDSADDKSDNGSGDKDDNNSGDQKDDSDAWSYDSNKELISSMKSGHDYFEREVDRELMQQKRSFAQCQQCKLGQLVPLVGSGCVRCGWPKLVN